MQPLQLVFVHVFAADTLESFTQATTRKQSAQATCKRSVTITTEVVQIRVHNVNLSPTSTLAHHVDYVTVRPMPLKSK